MQVIVFTDRFTKGLSLVSRIISTKNQLPVLGNVLLSAIDGSLYLSSTNLETAINTKIVSVIEKEGKITVPAKQLLELTSLIREEKVKLYLDGNILVIEGKKGKNKLTTTPASEFPPVVVDNKGEKTNIIIKTSELKKAIGQIAIATTQDENRPLLGGVKITNKNKNLELAATDGYRLSVKEVKTEKNETEKTFILPVKTLLEVVRIATEQNENEVKLSFNKEQNQAAFVLGETEVISRLIDGEFPNFQKIIPQSFTTRVVMDKEEILNSVKIASIFARESANIVKMKISEKTTQISANAPSVGENVSNISSEQEGDDIEVAFNYRFLIDFLSVVEEERIIFETNGTLNPGVFKPEKDPSFLHIIMPVRIQG